jgi:hypothetical protein
MNTSIVECGAIYRLIRASVHAVEVKLIWRNNMKILKHGKSRPRKFVCCQCGCEFVADVNEYKTGEYDGIFIQAVSYCPECDTRTTNSEPWDDGMYKLDKEEASNWSYGEDDADCWCE